MTLRRRLGSEFAPTLAAARRGDRVALNRLFETYFWQVERLAHREFGGARQRGRVAALFSTGDIVQETFRVVLRDLRAFENDDERAFVAYLASAVRHRLVDMLRFHEAGRRDHRRDAQPPADAIAEDVAGPGTRLAGAERVRAFLELLEGVPARERALLLRRFEDRAAFVELARELGYASPDAARKAFHRAHARLLLRSSRLGIRVAEGGES